LESNDIEYFSKIRFRDSKFIEYVFDVLIAAQTILQRTSYQKRALQNDHD